MRILTVRKLPPSDLGDFDLFPQGAADGTLRWQGVFPVDLPADTPYTLVPLDSRLKRLACLPHALEMSRGCLTECNE